MPPSLAPSHLPTGVTLSPTLASDGVLDPSTNVIAAICVIAVILFIPLCFYLVIIVRWCTDKVVQDEIFGKKSSASSYERELSELPPVLISFRNVCFAVPDRLDSTKLKFLLKDVSGWLAPNSLTAILGPSGCGKTTLLTLLADQDDQGTKSGDVFVNGQPRTGQFRRVCAYVQQNDVLMESLTVRESLWFACELRLSAELSKRDKIEIVNHTLLDLDLLAQADVSAFRLSGGQKRRLTVALELVARPSLVLLDEPTSGLDAGGALKLVQVLRNLADGGRTICVTIHQPRSDAFQLFDRCILMNTGRVVFNGPVNDILSHFMPHLEMAEDDGTGEPINPADFVLDLTHTAPGEKALMDEETLLKLYENSSMYKTTCNSLDAMHAGARMLGGVPIPPLISLKSLGGSDGSGNGNGGRKEGKGFLGMFSSSGKYASTLLKQAFTLTRRAFVNDIRNPAYITQWVLGVVMFLFLGMLYCYVDTPAVSGTVSEIDSQLEEWGACTLNFTVMGTVLNTTAAQANQTVIQCGQQANQAISLYLARVSLLYQLLACMFFSEMPQVAAVHTDRAIFLREHASRSYSSGAWILAWVTKLSFVGFCKGLCFTPFVYFSAQLPYLAEPYFLFTIYMGIMSTAGSSMALLVSSSTDSFETAVVSYVMVNVVAQNLCGFFIGELYIGWWFRWIFYANFFHYTFDGLVKAQTLTPEFYNHYGPVDYNNNRFITWQYTIIASCLVFAMQIGAFLLTWNTSSRKGDGAALFARLFKVKRMSVAEKKEIMPSPMGPQRSSRNVLNNLASSAGIQGAQMGLSY